MQTYSNRSPILSFALAFILSVSCNASDIRLEIVSTSDYYNDVEINSILKQAKDSNVLVLLWFSDIHGDITRLGRILKFKQYFDNYFNDILHSGDNVSREYSDGMSFWDSLSGTNKILNTIGNHDTAAIIDDNYDWKAKSGLDCYNRYMAPYVRYWTGVIFPNDAAKEGKCYYYKDYIDKGVRLIVLDCMVMDSYSSNYDPSQITWLESVLSDAKNNNMSVLLCSHCPPKSTPIDCSFTSNMFDENGCFGGTYGGDTEFISVVDNFIDSGGAFISWISGDLHKDYIGHVNTTRNKQPIIVCACALCSATASSTMTRKANTPQEDAFNILTVDVNKKFIRLKRVGATMDRDLKSHNIVSYNYEDHTLIESR